MGFCSSPIAWRPSASSLVLCILLRQLTTCKQMDRKKNISRRWPRVCTITSPSSNATGVSMFSHLHTRTTSKLINGGVHHLSILFFLVILRDPRSPTSHPHCQWTGARKPHLVYSPIAFYNVGHNESDCKIRITNVQTRYKKDSDREVCAKTSFQPNKSYISTDRR